MRKALSPLLTLAALAVVAVQAMALATRYFQPWLDGDYLLPERLAADVLGGSYPLAGWTLSSSPYLFPDFAASLLGRALLGGAPVLPYYVTGGFLALALLAGWSLHRVLAGFGAAAPVGTDRRAVRETHHSAPGGHALPQTPESHAWLLGALLVNALLAWQGFADHARWLWWLGTATFHGGAVLLGLAQFALWAGPADTAPSRGRQAVATVLLFLGLASDTLLLTQFVAPLVAALFITAPAPRWSAPRFRALLRAVLVTGVLALALKVALQALHWGNYPAVVRYAPTPSAILGSAGRMLSDLTGPVSAAVPAFVAFFCVGLGAVLWLARRSPLTPGQRLAGWFAFLSLLATLSLPVLAVYWREPQHGRYLLPCLVLPLWWLVTLLPVTRWRPDWTAGTAVVALLVLALVRLRQVDRQAWGWPYPEPVEQLDLLLAGQSRPRGLADYWNAQYLNALSHGGLKLNQVRPDGRVQFWGNNAFHHFESDPAGRLTPPRYSFIIVNGLDPAALRAKYGPADRTDSAGGYEVWFYDGDAATRLSALVDAEVRTFLGHRPGTDRIK